ncbi:hypothetical protein GCM10020256_10520 [Streptomyces thermocoprophilus]
MDRREIAALLAYIGRLDPRSIRTDEGEARDQLAQWHELLGDVPMATPHGWDARIAARQHYRTSPYQIQPADVVRPWESYRRNRPGPPLGPHTVRGPGRPGRLDRRAGRHPPCRRRRHSAARVCPGHHQQPGGINPRLQARLDQIGSCIPPAARAALAPFRPARAAREAAVAQGLPDALSVRCEWCLAPVGEPCRRRRIGPNDGVRAITPRATPHPGRVDLAAQQAQHAEQAQQPALA